MNFKKKSSTAVPRTRPHFAGHSVDSRGAFIAPTARRGNRQSATQANAASIVSVPRPTLRLCRWGLAGLLQGALFTACFPAAAQTQDPSPYDSPRYPSAAPGADTTVRRSPATRSDVFVDTAPDTYTVVPGDTLWGIAGRFLKQPWRWPEIWQMNRDQIRNPHWIYPGQTIVLDRLTGTMRLSTGAARNGTVKLSPQVRVEASRNAIPSIPPEAIEPYLTQPLIVESATMMNAPRVVASRERVVLGTGDIAYVGGITDPSVSIYQLFRPGRELRDPDTGTVIAYQADYLGTAQVSRPGNPATLTITSSKMEINVGDRLVAATKPVVVSYVPHAPANPVSGRIISIYSGVASAGPSMVVAVNRGADDGLEVGTVLAIKTFGRTIVDRTNGVREVMTLPEERKGLLFIFRVFNHVAYGLITSSGEPVGVGDSVTQP